MCKYLGKQQKAACQPLKKETTVSQIYTGIAVYSSSFQDTSYCKRQGDKPLVGIISNSEMFNIFQLDCEQDKNIFFHQFLWHCNRGLRKWNKPRKRSEGPKIRKEEVKNRKSLFLFVDMIVDIEKPKEFTKKVLERISKLNMITATKSIYR